MGIDWDRRVIPRWRESGVFSLSPDSTPFYQGKKPGKAIKPIGLDERLSLWRGSKDFGGAIDLINFSHFSKYRDLLREPAEYLLNGNFDIPTKLHQIAMELLGQEIVDRQGNHLEDLLYESLAEKVANIKRNLLIDPRNAVALVDIARLYAAQGQNKKAKNAILKAASLEPNHKFVLRSLARFLVHDNQIEQALFFLNKSPVTSKDPWLLATHISLETILGVTPKFMKKGCSFLEKGNVNPVHMTELAGSIATVYAFNGEIKKSKKLFNQSLISPNDNIVAQAIWASHRFGIGLNIKDEWFSDPFSHEARYYQCTSNAEFENAVIEARDWFLDEPYASRPMRAAAYICCILGHYEMAEKYSRRALRVDKNDIEVSNNLIYALAAQNKLDEAISRISEIARYESAKNEASGGHTLANWGMIQFRLGNYDEGELYYRYAIDRFAKDKDFRALAHASAYMAREAKLSNNPRSSLLLSEAIDKLKKFPNKTATKILEMSDLIEVQPINDHERITKWNYDAGAKVLTIQKLRSDKVGY